MSFKIQHPNRQRYTFLIVQTLTASFLLLTARMIYFQHSYYQSFLSYDAKNVLNYVILGLLTLVILDTIRIFLFVENIGPTKFTRIFGLWLKATYNLMQFLRRERKYIKMDIDKPTKVALLAMLVKFFYIPIMISFLVSNFGGIQNNLHSLSFGVTFDNVFSLLVAALFTVDTFIFTFGYLIEADFLGSRIKSVEPTILGWVVALATYPPFNGMTSTFFIMVTSSPTFLGQNVHIFHAARILILVCDFIFVAASVSLGFKASNLTNRGIVKRGPYAFVRHPAYTVKLLSWFIEGLILAPNWGYFAGWAGFAFVYFMRAITEERHLSQDPDYVEYKRQVKYRFVPGLV